ncbi:hypothetical protein ACLD0W_07870 [Alloalcanivorax sp. C16-1]|uniref:hypothetical protein n=1 Tax=Alloalcanivorax sp. C16-1 TaxID=3390051 RepID=UPI003970C7E1
MWCNHPDNRQSVPQGILDVKTTRVSCAFGAGKRADRGEPIAEPLVRTRRRIPVVAPAELSRRV